MLKPNLFVNLFNINPLNNSSSGNAVLNVAYITIAGIAVTPSPVKSEAAVSISLIASAVMIYFLIAKFKKLTLCQRLSLCLMIPGALGNLIDRAFYKNGVIDFLEFTFGSYHFPTFNFADSCLVVGVILLMISEIIVDLKETKEKEKAKEKSNNIDSKKLTEELKENSAEDDASTSDESTEEHDENSKE